ncbi:MAG: glucosaminidase domain-containing protein [Bacteroidales bacterium]|nr:glucosaminidase domain-containing protein [Bacteroidales bacterium]MDD4604037.1 glucosaminidase domain-containing protein [Bacteroidales bacterium]
MRKYSFCGLFFISIFFYGSVSGQKIDYKELVRKYIENYQEIARKEMMVYRIPASITLAQGIIESNAGQSKLALLANNHFGIKCHKDWTGKTYYQDDETPNECFRKYDSPFESFRDHSYFLTLRDRYKLLFELEITDYNGWAKGLQSAGYATNPQYAQKLITVIENYSLNQYDNTDFAGVFENELDDLDNPSKQAWLKQFMVFAIGPGNRNVYSNNDLQMVIARKKDNLKILSKDFKISVVRLMKFNDLHSEFALRPGQIVYLESKRRKAAATAHLMKQGETLYDISQRYGIKLKMLYKRNHLHEGVEPPKGTLLMLR